MQGENPEWKIGMNIYETSYPLRIIVKDKTLAFIHDYTVLTTCLLAVYS